MHATQREKKAEQARIECDTCNVTKGKGQKSTHQMRQTTSVGDVLILRVDRPNGKKGRKDDRHVPFERSYREREIREAFGGEGGGTDNPLSPPKEYKLKSVIEHRGADKKGHYVAACLSDKIEEEWMIYNDDRCYPRSWQEVSRMKASILIYERQAVSEKTREEVKTRLDFRHGSAGATCSRRPNMAPASSNPATRGQKARTKCRRIGLVRHKHPRPRVYSTRLRSGWARRKYTEMLPRRSRRHQAKARKTQVHKNRPEHVKLRGGRSDSEPDLAYMRGWNEE